MAHGASVTVSNTAPGFSGTVVARCEDGNVVQSSPTCNALFAGAEYSVPGTYSLTVPPGRYRVRVVGGGGGGRLSRWNCAFHMYSGSGGAAVDAIIEFAASTTISIRVGAGGNADEPTHPLCAVGASSGQQSSFGSWIIARGGGVGANIHYRHAWADNPSPGGGTYSVSGPVTIVRAENGQGIGTARGSHNVGHCGGNSGLGVGSGACAAGQRPGIGGGGFGNGTNYTNGSGNTAGGHGFVSVYPER